MNLIYHYDCFEADACAASSQDEVGVDGGDGVDQAAPY